MRKLSARQAFDQAWSDMQDAIWQLAGTEVTEEQKQSLDIDDVMGPIQALASEAEAIGHENRAVSLRKSAVEMREEAEILIGNKKSKKKGGE